MDNIFRVHLPSSGEDIVELTISEKDGSYFIMQGNNGVLIGKSDNPLLFRTEEEAVNHINNTFTLAA